MSSVDRLIDRGASADPESPWLGLQSFPNGRSVIFSVEVPSCRTCLNASSTSR